MYVFLLCLVQDYLWRETSLSALLSAYNLVVFAVVVEVMSPLCFSSTHSSVGYTGIGALAEDQEAQWLLK